MAKFLIQFFSSILPDPTGYGQGQTFLGSQVVTTDASGNADIIISPTGGLPADGWLSATATNQIWSTAILAIRLRIRQRLRECALSRRAA